MRRPAPPREETRVAWAMAAPALAGLLFFIALPFVAALVLSFTDCRLDSPLAVRFVGCTQYRRLFADPAFLRALGNTLLFAAVVVPVQTGIALALAVTLHQRFVGAGLYKSIFFMPVVFPMALVAVVWQLIYAPGPAGMLNGVVSWLSGGRLGPVDVLLHPSTALAGLMLLSVWQGLGFQMVVLLAGLKTIPKSRYEAAALDGAGPWQRFLHVTLPGLRNSLVFTATVTTILALRLFDQVWILTQGGPRLATTTVIFEAVRAVFIHQDVARGGAISVVFFVCVLAVTLVQRRLVREEREVA